MFEDIYFEIILNTRMLGHAMHLSACWPLKAGVIIMERVTRWGWERRVELSSNITPCSSLGHSHLVWLLTVDISPTHLSPTQQANPTTFIQLHSIIYKMEAASLLVKQRSMEALDKLRTYAVADNRRGSTMSSISANASTVNSAKVDSNIFNWIKVNGVNQFLLSGDLRVK